MTFFNQASIQGSVLSVSCILPMSQSHSPMFSSRIVLPNMTAPGHMQHQCPKPGDLTQAMHLTDASVNHRLRKGFTFTDLPGVSSDPLAHLALEGSWAPFPSLSPLPQYLILHVASPWASQSMVASEYVDISHGGWTSPLRKGSSYNLAPNCHVHVILLVNQVMNSLQHSRVGEP